jgi:predicted acylesterase/phospholipase RssA
MSNDPRPGPTAFVLAGGGTKGSFEVGVLQYLVGVAGIAPDIITATSAGAIAATVLAQARTLPEFMARVNEIEDDVLAFTQTEHVFGKQAWLGALDGTALGREIHQEITEGTRPPFPLTPSTVLAGDEVVPAASSDRKGRRQARRNRRKRQRHLARLVTGAGLRLPRVRRHLRSSGSAVLNLDPLADALRYGSDYGVQAVTPALISRPGLQLRLAVTALRAGVLRYVTEDGTLVESDARTPAPDAAAGPVDLVDGAIASASVPMVFPPHPMADDDYVDGGVIEIVPVSAAAALGATRIIAVVAVPLRLPRDERDYASAPAGYIGLRSMGMIGVAERQISNLEVHLPEGTTLTTIDPVVDVVGLFEVEPGLLRINKDYGWLRAADVVAEGDRDIRSDMADGTHAIVEARREAWRLEEALWAESRDDPSEAGTLALVREQKERVRELIDRRKQLGYPVPDGCESWWLEYEVHTAERPERLPGLSSGRRD